MSRAAVGWLCCFLVAVSANSAAGSGEELQDPEGDQKILVEFPGGTVSDYVALVRRQAGARNINVIINKEVGSLIMPEVVVTQVDPRMAIQLLEVVVSREVEMRGVVPTPGGGGGGAGFATLSGGVVVREVPADDEGNVILVVDRDGPPAPPPTIGVYSIRFLAESSDPEQARADLIKAIELGMVMSRRSNVEIKVHGETDLLFIAGTQEQLILAENIVQQIRTQYK